MQQQPDITDAQALRWAQILRNSRAFTEAQIAELVGRSHEFVAGELAIIDPPAQQERTAA